MPRELDKAPAASDDREGGTARIIYILYLTSLIVGITALIGVVMAYVYRTDAPAWIREHYRWQIRTFWIGILYTFVASLLTGVGIGFLLLLAVLVWFIVRCVKGLQRLARGEPPASPGTWLF